MRKAWNRFFLAGSEGSNPANTVLSHPQPLEWWVNEFVVYATWFGALCYSSCSKLIQPGISHELHLSGAWVRSTLVSEWGSFTLFCSLTSFWISQRMTAEAKQLALCMTKLFLILWTVFCFYHLLSFLQLSQYRCWSTFLIFFPSRVGAAYGLTVLSAQKGGIMRIQGGNDWGCQGRSQQLVNASLTRQLNQ